ncbi:Long-chain-fatty-acid--CoA ligase [Marinobacterium lacunae]|uniref:Long-chain-fatty-acid--CoA ligase n=1 Tax=Marinobacterium lacunae TaxID=1232683 RepID=A0A081G015_9GAMM|nr:AMP-binding protein [Marinobacterium lacunae]KEA64120.1 Long-chain-fatty-acid--CoA ligase [Marinobacterium lacunae]
MTNTLNSPSFIAKLDALAKKDPQGIYGYFEGEMITFESLNRKAESLAAILRREYGIQCGDRVAVMMNNSLVSLATIFALAKGGIVWVPVNARQQGAGLKYILEHSEPSLLIVDESLQDVVTSCGAHLPATITSGGATDALGSLLTSGARLNETAPTDTALFSLMYTSGTTGNPKGVQVTHAMMTHAVKGVVELCEIRPGDVFYQWEPFFHIGGAQVLLLPLFETVTIALYPRFSASRFWHEVNESGATHIHYLGGVLQILLKQPISEAEKTHRVRIAWGGGCPPDIWQLLRQRFGFEIRECYGMTEAASLTTCNLGGPVGSVGKALDWLDVSILGNDNLPVPAGQTGQIVVGEKEAGVLFQGYFKNPEATSKTLREGKLYTGDQGRLDAEGNLYFLGRQTDSVRCGGENVSAWEVENVVQQHPAVEECAMIGVRADIGEQDIKLFIKTKADTCLTPEELSQWLQNRLASYQLPRYIALVDDFERTPSLRIMKHKLPTETHDSWDRRAH